MWLRAINPGPFAGFRTASWRRAIRKSHRSRRSTAPSSDVTARISGRLQREGSGCLELEALDQRFQPAGLVAQRAARGGRLFGQNGMLLGAAIQVVDRRTGLRLLAGSAPEWCLPMENALGWRASRALGTWRRQAPRPATLIQHRVARRACGGTAYFATGMVNSAPLAMLSGQRCITDFCLV